MPSESKNPRSSTEIVARSLGKYSPFRYTVLIASDSLGRTLEMYRKPPRTGSVTRSETIS